MIHLELERREAKELASLLTALPAGCNTKHSKTQH